MAALRRFGLAFDIDGVLIRGNKVLPSAIQAMKLVKQANIPHIFITNGGGRLEQDKANQLSSWLGSEVKAEQVIQSHTPMQGLVEKYGDKKVLVGGPVRVSKVAEAYGYQDVVHIADVVNADPHVWPVGDHEHETPVGDPIDVNEISAILYMHDDDCWGRDLQVITDVLLSGLRNRGQQTPLYFSNPDFVYAANHPEPRLAQGAFREALSAVYKILSDGVPLEYTSFGKPNKPTYDFAKEAIEKQAGEHVDVVYGIGDNPHSDIAGANATDGWISVLLKTGVWDGVSEPPFTPDVICEDVNDAVEKIFEQHNVE